MRLLLVPLFSLLVVMTAAAQTPDGPQGKQAVQVGVFIVRPDGSIGGLAAQTAEADAEQFAGGIVTDGCRYGAGDSWVGAAMPAWARDGWEIRGRVDSLSLDHATIQLDWKRVRSGGAVVEQPVESRALTLPLDQVVTLDNPNPNNPECAPQAMIFGARYTSRIVHAGTSGAAAHAVGARGRSSLVRTGGGVATGTVYNAELWLVRSVPGKPESVVSTTIRVAAGPSAFGFAPVRVSVPGGTVVVHVDGQLQVVGGTGSQPVLLFEATRDASFTPVNRPPRDAAAPDPEGRASVTRPLPGPDDVLEFEMPPIALRGLPVPSDTFAVRLRLKPVKVAF